MLIKNKFIYRIVFIFLFSILTVSCKFNKEIEPVSQKTNRLDSLFNAAVYKAEIPGAVVYITKNKKEVFHKAYGFKNIQDSIPQKTNDIFRMASMSKGLTAVAVLQLYEKGALNLNDEVSKFIPEFKNPRILVNVLPDSTFTSVPAKSEITIQQLLTHSSGIGYGFQDDRYNALVIKNNISEGFCEDERTSLENTKKIASLPLLANPGEKNIYSMSYDVLSTVIEIVSGLRYDEYIQQNILAPLEMHSSFFTIPFSEREKLVKVYQPTEDSKGLMLTTYTDINYPIIENRQFFSGGADLCSTAKDYTNFVQMLVNNGKYKNKQILGEKYVKMMLSKQTNFDDGDADQGYAAWVTNKKGAEKGPMSLGSYGFGGFFDTYTWTDPKKQFTATLLLQMYPTNAHHIQEKYQHIVYDMIDKL